MCRLKLLLSVTAITFNASANSSKPGEAWEINPNIDTNVNYRKLEALADFKPLSCDNRDIEPCVPWENDFGLSQGAISIPCNKCYSMGNYKNGQYISLTGPLDIMGKLEFPEGTKVKLETTGIIVQGELAMTSQRPVDGVHDIVVKFKGADDIFFSPHPENAEACTGVSTGGHISNICNLGAKPFVVAGGKLTINGLPNDCPSWTTVEDYESSALSGKPFPTEFSKPPILPIPSEGTCDLTLIKQEFENGLGTWYGNLGAKEDILPNSHDGSNYLHVSNRNAVFQGPLFDIAANLRECIIPNIDYFFQAKIRLSASNGVSSSLCSGTGENCPTIEFGYLDSSDNLKYRPLAGFHGVDFLDNEWHDVKASFRFEASYVTPANVFTAILINGPEAGIDISIDDIHIQLPPDESYPDPNDVCGDLIRNGDAEQMGGFAAPMYSFVKSNTITVQDDGDGPEFFITHRIAGQDSLALSLTTNCLEEGAIYKFSMRLKVDSTDKAVGRVILKTHTAGTPLFDIITTCPSSSNDIGWITCEGDFTFRAQHIVSPKVELLVFIKDDVSDVHYDDISFTFHCGIICPMVLSANPTCWAPGAQVIFPSQTLLSDATTVTTLDTVQGAVITTPSNTVGPITTVVESPQTAGEIGLLSRNILFENGENNSDGPSLVVLRTPSVTQLIQGVEFAGFGDGTTVGRHAINFKQSGNSTGSIVSKNSIRDSNSRCVNIDGTDNVMISDNIAHRHQGHCFAVQGNNETGNVFHNNIGVESLYSSSSINDDSEDISPATFYIAYPTNTWIGNVAAGSEAYGFWFKFTKQSTEFLDGFKAPLTRFEDNKSHSNKWFGIRVSPYGYNPTDTATFANSTIYRNRGQGIYTHNTGNIVIDGGYFADNKIAIDLIQDNTVTIQNVTIVGFSPEYKRLSRRHPQTTPTLCKFGFTGIKLHITEHKLGAGVVTLSNITFSDFDETCVKPYAVEINPDLLRGTSFRNDVTLSQLNYIGFTDFSNKVNFCEADAADIFDVTLVDADGSLNPGDSRPGYIVSNAVSLIGGDCTVLVNSCARFCTNILPGDEVTIANANADTVANADAIANTQSIARTTPSSSAASGTASEEESVICLINPAFESGSDSWWGARAQINTEAGVNKTGNALKISNRIVSATGGAWQNIETSCMVLDAWYEVSADVKMTKPGSDETFDCNPTILWHNDPKSCAGIGLYETSMVPSRKEIAFTVGPYNSSAYDASSSAYNASGWTKLYGVFQATAEILSPRTIGFFVGRASTQSDISVDNIKFTPVTNSSVGVTNCTRPLQNGDAEIGDHRLWWVFGINDVGSRIELSTGYGNSSYAFKHTGTRNQANRGMLQKMEGSCFPAGSRWSVTAKFRYFKEDGSYISCNKDKISGSNSCPSFQMLPEGEFSASALVNQDAAPMLVGEWNDFQGEYTVEANADYSEVHFLVSSVNAGFNYEVDNIELVPI